MPEPMKVLVVCHGNINRSALCSAVVKFYAGNLLNLRQGGFVNPGQRAAKKMRDAAHEMGYDLMDHRSRLITREDLLWADTIVFMDGGNYKRLKAMLNGTMDGRDIYVICLGSYCDPVQSRIPDPNYMAKDSQEFSLTVTLIEEASRRLAEHLTGTAR